MRMYVTVPALSTPVPAVVVIQHQGGVDEFVQNMTHRLADAGYVAAAPDLYHRDGPDCRDDFVARRSRLGDRRIINDVNACVGFLQRHEGVDRERIGIVGFAWVAVSSISWLPPIRYLRRRWPITAAIFSAPGAATCLLPLSAPRRFTAHCKVISARRIKTHRRT